VRVVVKKTKDDSYFLSSEEWAAEREKAKDFAHTTTAYWWAQEQKLSGIEIVITFPDPRYDLTVLRV
jgi:hypothetical protein